MQYCIHVRCSNMFLFPWSPRRGAAFVDLAGGHFLAPKPVQGHTVDEILHQLVDALSHYNPIIYNAS